LDRDGSLVLSTPKLEDMSVLSLLSCATLVVTAFRAQAREIVFPDSSPLQYAFTRGGDLDEVDISGASFHGLNTFANLPYVECFTDGNLDSRFDIAFLGAQFDTVRLILSFEIDDIFDQAYANGGLS
jgi:hypothetical protein